MISNMVKGSRLSRARSITDRSVVEFKIVRKKPLITYCMIQGSASIPYVAFIDLKENKVGHYCPDFSKGQGWCKHLGKLLFMLNEEQVKAINDQFHTLKILKTKETVIEHLDKYKKDLLKKNGADENISLEKQLKIIDDMLKKRQKVDKILPSVVASIKKEFYKIEDSLMLFRLNLLVSEFPSTSRKVIFEKIQLPLQRALNKATKYFVNNFWIQSTLKRLEQAYMLNDVSYALAKPFSAARIKLPENPIEEEKIDAALVLKVLLRDDQKEYSEIVDKLGIKYSNDALSKRAGRILSSIKISSTVIPQLESWLQTQVKRKFSTKTHHQDYSDFLIYMMRTAGEVVKHQVNAGGSRSGMTTIPATILENNPCLNFIIEHIKESEREYLLGREIQNYIGFFSWLGGKKTDSFYIEKPRTRALESSLKKNTIIIQWDINLNKKFRENYHAYKGSQRLIIDPTSPINSVIQPFDYTLCIPQMKKLSTGTKITYPQQVLLPDQVVKLVLQGVPIISNVLRWDVVSKFVNEGYLSGGEVLASIAKSEKMNFIYGSFELVKALEEIVVLGKAGLTDVQFLEYKKKIKKESKSLTAPVREICREFVQSEGKPIQEILNLLNHNEDAKLKIVVDGIRNSSSVSHFRKQVVRTITRSYFKRNLFENKFFKQIESLQQSHYGMAMDVVADQLSVYYIDLENMLLGDKPTKLQSFANPLGKILMNKLQFPNVGNFTDTEKFELYLNLVKIRTSFVEEEKKRLDPKAQKQYLTELINSSDDGDFKERVRIVTQICLFNNNRALDFLRDLLADKDFKIRDIAFIALRHRKDKELKNHLKDLLEHELEPVRESSMKSMIKLNHTEIFNNLFLALNNESTVVRTLALETLTTIKYNQTKKLIKSKADRIFKSFVTCLEDTDENIRNKAVDNIVKEPFELIKDILFDSLENESPHVRNVASNILHLKGDDKLKKKTLIKVYNDEDLTIRQFALENIALRKYAESPKIIENNISGLITEFRRDYVKFLIRNDIPKQNLTNKTIQKIIEYFVHENLEFNKDISDTLKKYEDDSVHFLTQVLNDTKYKHKESIARFFEYLNTKKSVEQIIKLHDHDESHMRIFNLDYLVRNKIVSSCINIVERALNDPEPEVAFNAVQIYLDENIALKNYSKDFVPAALQTYQAKNIGFDGNILERLGKFGEQVLDNIEIILGSQSSSTKLSLIKLLVQIDSKRSKDKIIELLNHKDEIIKREAYDYIIWIDHPKARSLINKALKERDETIRRKAIHKFLDKRIAKANITDNLIKAMVTTQMENIEYIDLVTHTLLKVPSKALPIIKSKFKSQPVPMKNFLMGTVGMFKTPEAKKFIASLITDKDPSVRLFSLNYIKENSQADLKEILDKAVDDKDSKVRDIALRTLTENIPVESYSEKLIKMLVDNFLKKNDLPSSRAQSALRKIGEKAVPYLIEGLKSSELNVIRYSAEILGEIQANEAIDILIPMLTDDEVKIRRSAAYSLRRIRDSKAAKVMIDCLKDNDLYVRRSIIKGLGSMNCSEAKPILKNMKKNENKRKNPDTITIGMIDEALAKMK
ncbi:MAG: hypothetical protein HeimAB125_15140 [Candidatus Heimdallarchaeota archaeon AB_125]|nr:MAG: hypothetical protein HeimAB125_15140 [Candidatus Heimdallarchaeota archaeon AB_125]